MIKITTLIFVMLVIITPFALAVTEVPHTAITNQTTYLQTLYNDLDGSGSLTPASTCSDNPQETQYTPGIQLSNNATYEITFLQHVGGTTLVGLEFDSQSLFPFGGTGNARQISIFRAGGWGGLSGIPTSSAVTGPWQTNYSAGWEKFMISINIGSEQTDRFIRFHAGDDGSSDYFAANPPNNLTFPALSTMTCGAANTVAWISSDTQPSAQRSLNVTLLTCTVPLIGVGCGQVGAPIPGASVTLTGQLTGSGVTDTNGQITISAFSGNRFVGNVTIFANATGYISTARFFSSFNQSDNATVYLRPQDCFIYNNPGNFTVPATPNWSVVQTFSGQGYYSIFQATTTSLVGRVVAFPLAGSSNNYSVQYPTPTRATASADVGQYIIAISDNTGAIHCSAPFIIYSGSGAAAAQLIIDSSTLNLMTQTIQPATANIQTNNNNVDQSLASHNYIRDAVNFSYRADFLIPNMYLIAIIALMVALTTSVIIGRGHK